MRIALAFLLALALSACASMGNVAQSKVATVTHNDLVAAAAYATANKYPARAAVYQAIDAQLLACENAITAAEVAAPAVPANAGAFTAFEMAAEAAGNVSGIPASVKINCAPLPLITFPTLKLP
jgi:hypothetical protein